MYAPKNFQSKIGLTVLFGLIMYYTLTLDSIESSASFPVERFDSNNSYDLDDLKKCQQEARSCQSLLKAKTEGVLHLPIIQIIVISMGIILLSIFYFIKRQVSTASTSLTPISESFKKIIFAVIVIFIMFIGWNIGNSSDPKSILNMYFTKFLIFWTLVPPLIMYSTMNDLKLYAMRAIGFIVYWQLFMKKILQKFFGGALCSEEEMTTPNGECADISGHVFIISIAILFTGFELGYTLKSYSTLPQVPIVLDFFQYFFIIYIVSLLCILANTLIFYHTQKEKLAGAVLALGYIPIALFGYAAAVAQRK